MFCYFCMGILAPEPPAFAQNNVFRSPTIQKYIDVNYVLSITFVVGRTTRKSSRKSFYFPFTPPLRLQHVQEIPSHSKLKAHP